MTLEDLKIFLAVCEAGSLSAVARAQGCSQPAVSQHVARLEKDLKVPLLERRAKGVRMTKAGQVLYEGALLGLDSIFVAVRQIEQIREGESGSLGIATGGTTVKHFMRGAIVAFRERYPKVSLNFQSANSLRRCLEALRVEKADLALITMNEAIKGIEQRPMVRMPWMLVVSRHSFLSRKRLLKLKELSEVPYISLPKRSTSQLRLEGALLQEGIKLESTTMVDDWDTAVILVELGLGAAITPAQHGLNLARHKKVKAISIEGLPPVTFGWAARRWKSLSQVALDFVELVRADLESLADLPGFELLSAEATDQPLQINVSPDKS